MFERLRSWLLDVMRVPPEPEPPFGDPASVRVFRASRKFYWLRVGTWAVGQAAALTGILLGLVLWAGAERRLSDGRTATLAQASALSRWPWPKAAPEDARIPGGSRTHPPPAEWLAQAAVRVSPGLAALIWLAEGLGLAVYLGQLVVTYAAQRLDYELRWYMVTDRSLRIRTGLWKVEELTMSFANLQQVVITQGPVQHLLGISDVRVQSAGGGTPEPGRAGQGASMHTGVFHGVDNATEIRDLIIERLRRFRETGLGDPDEVVPRLAPAALRASEAEVRDAARELLEVARELRNRG